MTQGIDVSKYQGVIDWPYAAEHTDYAIIRLGYRGYGKAGTLQLDPLFHANIKGAIAAGLPIGVYFFSQATNAAEGKGEAVFCMEHLAEYELSYPVYFDAEYSTDPKQQGRADQISRDSRTAAAVAFCEALEDAGYYAGVYTYTSFALEGKIDYIALANRFAMWLADYRPNYNKTLPRGMHQHTGSGRVGGIEGDVDLNTCTVDYPAIIKAQRQGAEEPEVDKVETVTAEEHKALEARYNALQVRYDEIVSGIRTLLEGYK